MEHLEWYDVERDYLNGGEGHDTFYMHGTSTQVGQISNIVSSGRFLWVDVINGADTDYVANVQWTVEGILKTFSLTSSMISAATANSSQTVLGNLDAVTENGTIEVQVKAGYLYNSFVVWADWWDHSSISILATVDVDGSWA
nr:hypothetical protein [Neorhizobium tomejilense]